MNETWSKLESQFHAASPFDGKEQDRSIERVPRAMRPCGGSDVIWCGMPDLRCADRHGRGAYRGPSSRRIELGWPDFWPLSCHAGDRTPRHGAVFETRRGDSEYYKLVALKVAPDWRDLDWLRERWRTVTIWIQKSGDE